MLTRIALSVEKEEATNLSWWYKVALREAWGVLTRHWNIVLPGRQVRTAFWEQGGCLHLDLVLCVLIPSHFQLCVHLC